MVTYAELAKVEPRLKLLEKRIPRMVRNAEERNFWRAWRLIKIEFMQYVGWFAKDPPDRRLVQRGAYDVVYHHLFAIAERYECEIPKEPEEYES